jgi:hypothetical protein
MGTLTITKSYAALTPLMEVDIDAFRSGLLTLFNTDKLSSVNFSGSMNLTSSHFTGVSLLASDDSYIKFGASDDGLFGLDSSKNLVFNTAATATELRFYATASYYTEVATNKLNVPGNIIIGSGGSGYSVLHGVSNYKKPVIEYSSTTAISLQNNTATSNETVIYFPTFVASVTESSPSKYRYAAISATANGYAGSHTGSALGGKKVGMSLTNNYWYYVYAVGLRGGSDYSASTARFIMVYDDTAPTVGNISTLNTEYGEGNWVYLGAIRHGFGATGTNNVIIKFLYSNKGWCTFYEKSSSGYGGLNLAYSTTDGDDTSSALYTIANGVSGNVIPATFGKLRFSLNRERVSDWKLREGNSSSDVLWAGGFQTDDGTLPHGFIVETGNTSGNAFYQERKSNNAGTARSVTLAAFQDPYVTLRRGGHGA